MTFPNPKRVRLASQAKVSSWHMDMEQKAADSEYGFHATAAFSAGGSVENAEKAGAYHRYDTLPGSAFEVESGGP